MEDFIGHDGTLIHEDDEVLVALGGVIMCSSSSSSGGGGGGGRIRSPLLSKGQGISIQ